MSHSHDEEYGDFRLTILRFISSHTTLFMAYVTLTLFAFGIMFQLCCCKINQHVRSRESIQLQIQADREAALRLQAEIQAEDAERREREIIIEKYSVLLKSSSMVLTENDFCTVIDEVDLEQGPNENNTKESQIIIPERSGWKKRHISTTDCIICLDKFKVEDEIIWSQTNNCSHIFHKTCILTWISRGSSKCPVCRCDFAEELQTDKNSSSPIVISEST